MILGIKGDKINGNKIIQLLEMLGGRNFSNLDGKVNDFYYYIWNYKIYHASLPTTVYMQIYTLEEFYNEFPYNFGDCVKLKNEKEKAYIVNMKWENDTILYQIKKENENYPQHHWLTVDDFESNLEDPPLNNQCDSAFTSTSTVDGELKVLYDSHEDFYSKFIKTVMLFKEDVTVTDILNCLR